MYCNWIHSGISALSAALSKFIAGLPRGLDSNREIGAIMTVIGLLTSLIAAFSHSAGDLGQTSEDPKSVFPVQLFNGVDLTGWKAESQANWSVQNGQIHVSNGTKGLLRTTSQFDEFELELEFSASPETNSGVFLLTSPKPTNPTDDCYEVNIIDPERHDFATGSIVGRAASKYAPHLKADEWHKFRIKVETNKVIVETDGEISTEYFIEKGLGRGYIGLQYNEGPVAFRNISLRPLNLTETLVDEKHFEKWRQEPIGIAEYSKENTVRMRSAAGYLESPNTYADSIIVARSRLFGDSSNSGIFFRCIPEQKLNGYECQLNNALQPNTDDQPLDCGTGGIYRRQNAKKVIATNPDWFEVMIVTNGPHIATWVNGIQMVDWTDQRKPNSNPRKGLRLDAGTIMLQSHDTDTDVEFSKLQVREIHKRNR